VVAIPTEQHDNHAVHGAYIWGVFHIQRRTGGSAPHERVELWAWHRPSCQARSEVRKLTLLVPLKFRLVASVAGLLLDGHVTVRRPLARGGRPATWHMAVRVTTISLLRPLHPLLRIARMLGGPQRRCGRGGEEKTICLTQESNSDSLIIRPLIWWIVNFSEILPCVWMSA
jgi:hypothetical protein